MRASRGIQGTRSHRDTSGCVREHASHGTSEEIVVLANEPANSRWISLRRKRTSKQTRQRWHPARTQEIAAASHGAQHSTLASSRDVVETPVDAPESASAVVTSEPAGEQNQRTTSPALAPAGASDGTKVGIPEGHRGAAGTRADAPENASAVVTSETSRRSGRPCKRWHQAGA